MNNAAQSPTEVLQNIYKLERYIVTTLAYEINGVIDAVHDPTPIQAFDTRIISLRTLIEDLQKLRRLCVERESWKLGERR